MKRVKKNRSVRKKVVSEALLRRYLKPYDRLKRRLRDLGFICQGTIARRTFPCGKPACACRTDPARRHGPYYHWTRKVAGRTQGRILPAPLVPLYEEAFRNQRRLNEILEEMREVSISAFEAARIDLNP